MLAAGLLAAALASALVAGVFWAFSTFVMASLAAVPGPEGLRLMREVNVQVMRSSFLAVFLAAAPLSAALGAWGIAAFGAPGAGAALAGALAYLAGCFAVTMLGNVPLNNRLARATPDTAEAVWRDYRRRWTRWNHVRTLASLVAAALFTLAYRAV